jgi:hypothetical protein
VVVGGNWFDSHYMAEFVQVSQKGNDDLLHQSNRRPIAKKKGVTKRRLVCFARFVSL